MSGLIVPSSPEGLGGSLERSEPTAPTHPAEVAPLEAVAPPEASVAEVREAEQSVESALPVTGVVDDGPGDRVDDPAHEAAEAAEAAGVADEEVPDRGALLRMFSSLRDS